jgi:hypothetical protein
MQVDKEHPLAIEYRCIDKHIQYHLVPYCAWPLPIACSCGKVLYPVGEPSLSEIEKQEALEKWTKE